MLDRRPPAPPLLRPQRRQGRFVLAGLVLGVLGLGGGLLIGLGLRHPPPASPPAAQQAAAPAAIPAPFTPAPVAPPGPDRAAPDADLATLRASVAAEQARLSALREARQAAEADLATTRRELALAQAQVQASRREAASQPPPVAQQPAPQIVLGAPPRPLALPPGMATTPAPAAPTSSGQPRVFLHMRAGSVAAADSAAELVPQLRDAGFDVADTRLVTSTPSQRVVRYFHTEDAAAAARLAGRLGRGWAIQDFRNYEPAPSPGTLEIWLPDR